MPQFYDPNYGTIIEESWQDYIEDKLNGGKLIPYTPGMNTTVPAPMSLGTNPYGTPQATAPTTAGIVNASLIPFASAGEVINPITVIPFENALDSLKSFARDEWGSDELGVIRWSSEVLENERTGIRPGTMERIVLPAWARRQKGGPF